MHFHTCISCTLIMPTFSPFYWSGWCIMLLFLITSKIYWLMLLIFIFLLPTLLIFVIKLYASFYLFQFIVVKLWSFWVKNAIPLFNHLALVPSRSKMSSFTLWPELCFLYLNPWVQHCCSSGLVSQCPSPSPRLALSTCLSLSTFSIPFPVTDRRLRTIFLFL